MKIGPEGSFFGLFADNLVLDDEELEEEFASMDHFSHLFHLCVC